MARSPNAREWRRQQLQIVNRSQRDVLRILEQARKDINFQLLGFKKGNISERVRAMQLRQVRAIIAREQAGIWRDIGNVVRARRVEAAARMIQLGAEFDAFLFRTLAHSDISRADIAAVAKAEERAAVSAMDRMLARAFGQSYTPLSQRVYRSNVWINGVLDRKVNSALVRGLSAREFAIELQDFINPDTPGGIRYAAMRLARSEINNAAHATAVNSAFGKPWISGMQWQLSASHPKADECDDLAEGGLRGDGIYDVDKVPAKPHPQCFCTVVPVSVSDEQFITSILSGGYDRYASRYLDLAS